MRLGVEGCVVGSTIVRGDVVVVDGVVTAVGAYPAGGRGVACPGFVDLQVNGFAGVSVATADDDGYRRVGEALCRTGVTAWLPTIPTSAPEVYVPALQLAGRMRRTPPPTARPIGVHLEGPFLSDRKPGAHERRLLQVPDPGLVDTFLRVGPVSMMTIAPELPGAIELIRHLVGRGIVVSLGHTDCDAATAHAAFDAGASAVTHLWNAQRSMTARDGAVGGVALARDDVFVGVIADLVHVGPETLKVSLLAAGDRLVIVSDAVAPAGLSDGEHPWGGDAGDRTVTVDHGAVRLADGTLAGSVGTLDASVRNVVGLGLPLGRAVHAVTAAPARLLGRSDLGRLAVGAAADVTVLDDSLAVSRVLVRGAEAYAA